MDIRDTAKRGWRRYRGMPTWLQVGLAVLLVVVVAASVSGGNDDDPAASERTTTTSTTEPSEDSTTTTEPEELAWSYTSTAGETYKVVADDDTGFTGDVPTPVSIIDGAADSGCVQLQTEHDFWADAAESDNSDEYKSNAAAYTAYAKDALVRLGC